MDDQPGSGFKSGVGQGSIHAACLLAADLIIIDEISMLTPWVANRVSMTLQSIADTLTNRLSPFGGKNVLFVGDFRQLPPVVPNVSLPVMQRLIIRTGFRLLMHRFRLERPMRSEDADWVAFLLSVARGQPAGFTDWRDLSNAFGVTITTDIDSAMEFFRDGLTPRDPFPLDRLWIAPEYLGTVVEDSFILLPCLCFVMGIDIRGD
jgi:hypothetical protein